MAKKTYSELLKDPRWQKVRLQILERDGFSCQGCGSEHNTLHVHHYSYRFGNDPWDYPMDNFVTLCEGCHALETEICSSKWFKSVSIKSKIPAVKLWYFINVIGYVKTTNSDLYQEFRNAVNKNVIHVADKNKALTEFLLRDE